MHDGHATQLHYVGYQQPSSGAHHGQDMCRKVRRRHTCLQQARNATDGFHDSALRPEERVSPRRARCYGSSLSTNGADYAESGQGAGSGLGRGSVHELGRSRWHVDGSGGVRRGTGSAADWPTRDLYYSAAAFYSIHTSGTKIPMRGTHMAAENPSRSRLPCRSRRRCSIR
jgi:hypothetical protein